MGVSSSMPNMIWTGFLSNHYDSRDEVRTFAKTRFNTGFSETALSIEMIHSRKKVSVMYMSSFNNIGALISK
jgi:hypothetical protein